MPYQLRAENVLTVPVEMDGRAVIQCPQCVVHKTLNVSRFKDRKQPLSVTCKCGNIFSCIFLFPKSDQQQSGITDSDHSDSDEDLPIVDIIAEKKLPKLVVSNPQKDLQSIPSKTSVSNSSASRTSKQLEAVKNQKAVADTSVITFFVDDKGFSTITCPQCQKAKNVSVGHGKALSQQIPVKCSCGQTFSCKFVPKKRIAVAGKVNVYYPMLKGELSGRKPVIFHVDSKNEASIMCPECNHAHHVKPDEDPILNNHCVFNCQCGTSFPFKIDFRRSYRKAVDLKGTYFNQRLKEEGSCTSETYPTVALPLKWKEMQ